MDELNTLLVDDEEEFVGTLAERLELRGIRVRVALDGERALGLLEEETPHVVVLDIMMPGMSGIEVLRQIKQRRPDLPVILLTGHGSTRDGIEGMQMGAFDYLMKPINIEELLAKMQAAATAGAARSR